MSKFIEVRVGADHFWDIKQGRRPYIIDLANKSFEAGDFLLVKEWKNSTPQRVGYYSGYRCVCEVTCVDPTADPDLVVVGFNLLK